MNTRTSRRTKRRLRLLSFNIQTATPTDSYRSYLTNSWRQLLPSNQRVATLDAIAGLVAGFDAAGLQEVDSGSLRSGFINQSRYIATHAALPYWFHQSNRKVGSMAYSGIGFMGHLQPDSVEEHRLPGALPGRGALFLNFGGAKGLTIVVLHLALGQLARGQQLRYLARELSQRATLIVMGDFNARADSRLVRAFRDELELEAPTSELATYPSWKPRRALDHILVSRDLHTHDAEALDVSYSDHLPVALTVDLPAELVLASPVRSSS